MTQICGGGRVHVTLVRQEQVRTAPEGRAVAGVAFDSVLIIPVCVRFERSVEVILE